MSKTILFAMQIILYLSMVPCRLFYICPRRRRRPCPGRRRATSRTSPPARLAVAPAPVAPWRAPACHTAPRCSRCRAFHLVAGPDDERVAGVVAGDGAVMRARHAVEAGEHVGEVGGLVGRHGGQRRRRREPHGRRGEVVDGRARRRPVVETTARGDRQVRAGDRGEDGEVRRPSAELPGDVGDPRRGEVEEHDVRAEPREQRLHLRPRAVEGELECIFLILFLYNMLSGIVAILNKIV